MKSSKGCRLAEADKRSFVGAQLDEEVRKRILERSRAIELLVLSPNEPMPGNFRQGRIMVQVDTAGVIIDLECT
jgi:hypothetical protein